AGERGPGQQPALRHRGADLDLAVGLADGVELGNARDVDEDCGLDHAQIEHGDERLAAGEHARLLAVLGEKRERLLDRVRPRVVERARLHRPAPARSFGRAGSGAATSAWMRRGVAGNGTSFTPSASAMALAMQAGTLMQLPSASPLAPSGVSGEGGCLGNLSTAGISAHVGTR